MNAHQAFEKSLAFVRVLVQQFKPRMQAGQQARNHLDQLGRLPHGHFSLGAPDQIRHHQTQALRVNLVAGVFEPGLRHGQRPGAEQKVHHQAGHVFQV